MKRLRLVITTAVLALAAGACADILGIEELVETPAVAPPPVADAGGE